MVSRQPSRWAQNKRYLVSDINRMFGGRWSQFPQSDETARAAWLENVVTAFFAAAGPCAGIWICIRPSARPTMSASACCRSAISREEDFLSWLGDAGLEALVFHQSPGGTLRTSPVSTLVRCPVRWSWESAAVWGKRSHPLCANASRPAGAAGRVGSRAYAPDR
jgi:succinylglutamate desuccinylase